ncbi:MAG: hypothetical protein QOF45_1941 [Gaiellaceae bacterium]|jgi:hypothetical protein|nr:hypothetical protein [Gaiellaceae bacterium]
MGLFRRDRPLHEQLAEEGGLELGSEPERIPSRLAGLMHGLADGFLTAPPDEFGNPSPLGEVGVHGVPRARRWDVVATAQAELPGDGVHFVALPDGTLVVEEDVPDGSLTPLADAIEVTLNAPYRAEAVRREDGVWAVAANRIHVREFPEAEKDELELVEDGSIVIGRRLDGDLFEIEVTPI